MRLPSSGVWVGAAGAPDGEAITAIGPPFVALDLTVDAEGLDRLVAWLKVAEETNTDLVVRLPASGRSPAMEAIVQRVSESHRVRVLILVDRGDKVPPARLTSAAREAATRVRPELDVAVGTRGHFADLNRSWPRARSFDSVAFPLDPMTHTDDELSLIENLAALPDIIATAQRRGRGLQVHVVPVASGAGRAASWPTLGSAWTVASLLALGWAGASSVAYDGAMGPTESRGTKAGTATALSGHASGRLTLPTSRALRLVRDLGSLRLVQIFGLQDRPLLAAGLESAGVRGIVIANLSAAPGRISIRRLRGLWRRLASPDEVRFAGPVGDAGIPSAWSLRSEKSTFSIELAGHAVAILKSTIRA